MRILLVEDDPGVRRFVIKGLREQAYAVDTAATGEDALYQADINEYDLIILPAFSGIASTAAKRRRPCAGYGGAKRDARWTRNFADSQGICFAGIFGAECGTGGEQGGHRRARLG
jgi:hypothetical protein